MNPPIAELFFPIIDEERLQARLENNDTSHYQSTEEKFATIQTQEIAEKLEEAFSILSQRDQQKSSPSLSKESNQVTTSTIK